MVAAAPQPVAPQFGAPQFVAPQVAVAAPQFVAPNVVAAAPQTVAPQVVAPQQQVAGQGQPGLSAAAHQTPVQWLPRLKCNFCGYETNNQNELLYHVESKHRLPKFKCDKCPQTFGNSEALVLHIVQAHTSNQQRERNILTNGRWTCSFFSQEFSGDQARDNHVYGHHQCSYLL